MRDMKPMRITFATIPRALEQARQFRMLQEPEQAESICLDILEIDSRHHDALILLILAVTDQFSRSGQMLNPKRASRLTSQLTDAYEILYYRALICERRARAMLVESMSRSFTWEYFREAMQLYRQAMDCRPERNDDAILRWNACLRTVQRERLEPRTDSNALTEQASW